ncbi:DUF742 domain-containing protein [Nocardioides anomalus]|jgi:hypothetical protein|uniref:DUF742 domain-containing protein n=1 Tax=Nocardioides anomalus TaxID=2712223 RepID=A0A6G6WFG7_9ACTN|nr:DUF742 domain-containing protein [Nocardioides anomalus]QIG43903.1 DUF742 domain-containing protein [Nocardioides anomalus]
MALPTQPWEPEDDAPVARVVRPYTLTGGRTAPKVELPFEATLRRESGTGEPTDPKLAQILAVCDKRSVAEVSAHVHMPIGVTRVLLGDLIEQGFVRVQATLTADSSHDERRELIERTLRGLRTL